MKIKKIISLLLAVIMITALPVTSFARSMSDTYSVYVNGIQITKDNCDDVLGDGGSVKYSNNLDTLTLTNAKITAGAPRATRSMDGIYISGTCDRIELVGNNVIDLRNFKTESGKTADTVCALRANNSLTICGNGSLKLYTPDCIDSTAIKYDRLLTFDGCKVEIYAGDGKENASGIDTDVEQISVDTVYVENGADLKVCAGSVTSNYSSVIEHVGIRSNNLKVDKTSKCYVETGDLTAGDVDYVINGAVTAYAVFGGGEVTALAGKVTYTSAWYEDECISYGIYDIGWPMNEEHVSASSLSDMTIIASGYDCGTYSTNVYLYDMSDKIDILVSENIDGSDLKYLKDGERLGNYKYVMICPEGEVVIEEEEEEKSFFKMVIDFFVGLFEGFINFIMSLL